MDDKEDTIIRELKRTAQDIRYGTIRVEFKVSEGKIFGGEVIEQRKKLG